jgi:hypothetical protein
MWGAGYRKCKTTSLAWQPRRRFRWPIPRADFSDKQQRKRKTLVSDATRKFAVATMVRRTKKA